MWLFKGACVKVKSGLTRKQIYRIYHTTSREQLIYDVWNVNQFLRVCSSYQSHSFLSFLYCTFAYIIYS